MHFVSYEFSFLVLLTLFIYYQASTKQAQVAILIISSLFFYGYNYPGFLAILLTSIVGNIVCIHFISSKNKVNSKTYSIIGVSLNLFLLIFFKYGTLIGRSFFYETDVGNFLIAIPLPLGISFFTFQGISLILDTASGKVLISNPEQSSIEKYLTVGFYISFFPQLVAGPIVKANDFFGQIVKKNFSNINIHYCIQNLITGYFLKMVVSDNLKDHTFWIAYPHYIYRSGSDLLSILIGSTTQIFADFAGYSLIAIGLAGLFGYQLKSNFLFPFVATSLADLWRRWHISLHKFLKEYLFIPMSINKSKVIVLFNVIFIMTIGGLWHGTSWNFALWGLIMGVVMIIEMQIRRIRTKWKKFRILEFTKWLHTYFLFILIGLFFLQPSPRHAITYAGLIFSNNFLPFPFELSNIFYLFIYSSPVFLYHLLYLIKTKTRRNISHFYDFIYALMLFLILTNSGTTEGFFYFQF